MSSRIHQFALAAVFTTVASPVIAQERLCSVSVDLSTAPIPRTAGLISAASQVVHCLADLGLERWIPAIREDDALGTWLRVGQVYFMTLPIASLSQTISHELGHSHYLKASDSLTYDFKITQWPWPIPIAGASVSTNVSPSLRVISAGPETDFVLQGLVAERIYRSEAGTIYDWSEFAQAKIRLTLYVLSDLRADLLDDEDAFYRDTHLGDPRRYALEFERARQGVRLPSMQSIRDRARLIRRGAALHLLDMTLLSAIVRGIQYIESGERIKSPLTIPVGGLRLVPGFDFVLTEGGYEHRVALRLPGVRDSGSVHVRRLTAPNKSDILGIGAQWRRRQTPVMSIVTRADYWHAPDEGAGHRLELGFERKVKWLGQGLEVGAAIGYKTRGVLPGQESGGGFAASIAIHTR